MFTSNKKIIGLDYGPRDLRVVEIEPNKESSPRLSKWAVADLPAGVVDAEGKVLAPRELAHAIKALLKSTKISTRRVVSMVPSAGLVVRNIVLPQMEPEELYEAAKWEAAQYLPFPVEEASFDFVPIKKDPSLAHLQDSEVLMIAAHVPEVEALVQALQGAGLELMALDAGPLALARAVGIGKISRNQYPPRQITDDPLGEAAVSYDYDTTSFSEAIIDLGHGTTDVSIFHDEYLRVNRSFTIGLDQFDQKIAEKLGVELEEAALIRANQARVNPDSIIPIGDDPETLVATAVQEVMEELLEEVQRSLDYYRAQNGWVPIDRVVVTGEGTKLRGMVECLSNSLGMTLEVANPLSSLEESDFFPIDIEVYSLAIGLALWEVAGK